MAIANYSKLIPKINKWNADEKKVFDQRFLDVDKARVMALKADNWLAARRPEWQKLHKELFSKNSTWLSMAEEIVRLQKELVGVKKSKDKAKFKALELDIKKVDSYAKGVVKDFNRIYDKAALHDKKLGEVIRALLKVGLS